MGSDKILDRRRRGALPVRVRPTRCAVPRSLVLPRRFTVSTSPMPTAASSIRHRRRLPKCGNHTDQIFAHPEFRKVPCLRTRRPWPYLPPSSAVPVLGVHVAASLRRWTPQRRPSPQRQSSRGFFHRTLPRLPCPPRELRSFHLRGRPATNQRSAPSFPRRSHLSSRGPAQSR